MKNKGFRRVIKATHYSLKGLKAALQSEAAVRQEMTFMLILIPVALWIDVTMVEKLLLIMSLFIVLITELLNTAIEAVVDRVGPEMHELSGKAKDVGSAAVFISLLLALMCWSAILFDRFA